MSAPVIGRRNRYVPGPNATIDASHPSAQKIEFCYVPGVNARTELAKGYQGTITGTVSTGVPTPFGAAIRPEAINSYVSFPSPDEPFLGALTVMFVGVSASSSGFLAGKASSISSDCPFALLSSVSPRLYRANSKASYYQYSFSSSSLVPLVLVVSVPEDIASNGLAWTNGNYLSSTSTGVGSLAPTGLQTPIRVGAQGTANASSIAAIVVWSRQISFGEAQALYANPFCFLKV